MAELESEFVRHIPCDNCGSSDANSLYSDGHTFCFSCHTYQHDVESTPHMTHDVTIQGEPVRLKRRKISEDVCTKYKIYTDGNVLRFYYTDKSGRIVGCKVKSKDKTFKYEGKVAGALWGQNLAFILEGLVL